jgi:hypothetical protein
MLALLGITAFIGGSRARVLIGLELGSGAVLMLYNSWITYRTLRHVFGWAFGLGAFTSIAGSFVSGWAWRGGRAPRPVSWVGWVDHGIVLAGPTIRWVGLGLFVLGAIGWPLTLLLHV